MNWYMIFVYLVVIPVAKLMYNFKIEGRTGNLFSLVETYSNFLIKPEYQGLFRIQVLNNLKANKIVSINKPLPQKFVMPGEV